jgi:hypothetical protein
MADTDKSGNAASEDPELIGSGADDSDVLAALDKPIAPAWIAKTPGDTIVGAFIELTSGVTEKGPAPVVVLGTAEGERAVFLFYETLKTGFRRAAPQPGERVAVRFNGMKAAKNPTAGRNAEYHDYTVAVDREAGRPADWSNAL